MGDVMFSINHRGKYKGFDCYSVQYTAFIRLLYGIFYK